MIKKEHFIQAQTRQKKRWNDYPRFDCSHLNLRNFTLYEFKNRTDFSLGYQESKDQQLLLLRNKEQSSGDQNSGISLGSIVDCIKTIDGGISTPQAVFILFSISFGSAIVVLPHTVSQLGIVPWLIFTSVIIILWVSASN